MMMAKGDTAPVFTLLGVQGTTPQRYQIGAATNDRLALLVFTPSCKTEKTPERLHPLLDFGWFQLMDRLEVYVITKGEDLPARTVEYCRSMGLPLMADTGCRVANAYGVEYGESGLDDDDVAGGLFLVDDSGAVHERWEFPGTADDLSRIRQTIQQTADSKGLVS